jgi:two-component system response regulator FixJ
MSVESVKSLVYIVDDDQAVRTAIADLVEDMGCTASPHPTAEDFLEAIDDGISGNCLILDIRMPGMSGMDLLDVLCEKKAVLPVILVSGHGDISMAVEALKKGALDFIEKPFREQVLWEKIQKALKIGSEKTANQIEARQLKERISQLSPKENRVVKYLLEGKIDKEIAIEIGVTRRAVAFQRSAAFKKLQVSSIVEVAKTFARLGISI